MTNSTFFVTIIYIRKSDSLVTYLVLTLFCPILDQCKLYLTQRCLLGILFFFIFSSFFSVHTKFWQLWFYVSLIESLFLFWLNLFLLMHLIIEFVLISLLDWRVIPLHRTHTSCLGLSQQ